MNVGQVGRLSPGVAGIATGPAWARPFQFAADFRTGFVRLGGRRVSMETIDSLYHSRASARRAEDSAGASREFGYGVMAITDRGYDSREGWNVLNSDPLDPRAWTVSGAAAANQDGSFSGMTSARRVISQGAAFHRAMSVVSGGIVAGQTYHVRYRYAAGSSPRVHVGIRSAIDNSRAAILNGPVGAVAVTGSAMGTWGAITQTSLPDGVFDVSAVFTATETTSVLLEIGPDTATAGLDVIAIAAQITPTVYQMPWGSGTVAGDSLVIPAADAGLVFNPVTDNRVIVMAWRGAAFESAVTFAHLMQARTPTGNLFLQYRKDQNYRLDLNSGAGASTRALSGAIGSSQTFVAAWRPDGSWVAVDSSGPFSGNRAMFNASLDGISVGCSATDGLGRVNATHRIAAVGAFSSFSNVDAQNLYNQVAAA